MNKLSQKPNPQQLRFIKEYLRNGNKKEAYLKIFGGKESAARQGGYNLCKRPYIKAAIEQMREEMEANLSDDIKEEMKENYLSLHEYRMKLADTVRGNIKVNKHFKMKDDQIKTIQDDINPNVVLNAIVIDIKIANGWYDRKQPPELKLPKNAAPAEKKQQKPPKPKVFKMFFGRFPPFMDSNYDPLTLEEEKAIYQLSLTHDNIDITAPKLTKEAQAFGCRLERNMQTGRWYGACPGDENLEGAEMSGNVTIKTEQPYDDEQLANIIKNSKIIQGMLNNEHIIMISHFELYRDDEHYEAEKKEYLEIQEKIKRGERGPGITDFDLGKEREERERAEREKAASAPIAAAEQAYRPVKEIWEEHWKAWCNTASQRDHAAYLEAYTMYKAMQDLRQLPKAKQSKVWEFHPTDITLMRKKIA